MSTKPRDGEPGSGAPPAPWRAGPERAGEHPITDADRERALSGSSPFDALLGLELLTIGRGVATAQLTTGERHTQPTGIVHGGVYAAIAESVASVATNWSVRPGRIAVGLSNATNFLRPARAGQALCARARALHTGRSTWVWDVSISTDDDPCAVSRVVVAVIEPRA